MAPQRGKRQGWRVGHQIEDRGHETPCWIWQGSINNAGYGSCSRIGADGKRYRLAHRWYYVEHAGSIPADRPLLDHACRVTACVNPDHLRPVTMSENIRLGDHSNNANRRKTRCPKGHAYDYVNPANGKRACKTCGRAAYRKYRKNKKERG
jgi:hypothetical protein